MPDSGPARGRSLVEVLFALSITLLVSGSAVGAFLTVRDDARGRGAARALAMRIAMVRLDALRRGVSVGLVFRRSAGGISLQMAIDGNANGLRSQDLAAQVDRIEGPPFRLSDEFPGVAFGLNANMPPVEGDGPWLAAGEDPVQIGSSSILVFAPSGSGSSGTLYLTGPGRRQYAVRVFGPTGRVRVFEFRSGTGHWVTP